MGWVRAFLVTYPELSVYLTIAIGYLIGSVGWAGISLGPVTGSLFAGLLIGQLADVPVSGMAKSFLFLLFLFGIGYSVGPQFMQAMRRDGTKPVLLAIVVALAGLAAATTVAKVLGLDPGYAGGLVSGALTESPALGTATEAINALPLPQGQRAVYVSHVAVAHAVCYLFGVVFVMFFLTDIAPKLMKIDLRAEALELERMYESGEPSVTCSPLGAGSRCGPTLWWMIPRSPARACPRPRRACRATAYSYKEFAGATRSSRPNRARSCSPATSWPYLDRGRPWWSCSAPGRGKSRTGSCWTCLS